MDYETARQIAANATDQTISDLDVALVVLRDERDKITEAVNRILLEKTKRNNVELAKLRRLISEAVAPRKVSEKLVKPADEAEVAE